MNLKRKPIVINVLIIFVSVLVLAIIFWGFYLMHVMLESGQFRAGVILIGREIVGVIREIIK